MQVEMGEEFLPELDRDLTRRAVEGVFDKYRIYKFLELEEREAKITASYDPRYHGSTNQTSDQTADIAIHNVDEPERRRRYCERVERIVNKLPRMERFLLTERYMSNESEYMTDMAVYSFKFSPPISETFYYKIRWKAFYKVAFSFDENKLMDIRTCIKPPKSNRTMPAANIQE